LKGTERREYRNGNYTAYFILYNNYSNEMAILANSVKYRRRP